MTSSIKEYSISHHDGWFTQPTITKSDELDEPGTWFSYTFSISDGKRTFKKVGRRLFDKDMDAANAAYTKGRELVDRHNEKIKASLMYRITWLLGFSGVFKD